MIEKLSSPGRGIFLTFCIVVMALFSGINTANAFTSWAVYYSNELRPEAFDSFDLVVLDSEEHPKLMPMVSAGKTVLGYISLGEAASYRHWFAWLKEDGLLLRENKNWPGSYFIDLRDKRWTKLVIEDLIPAILRQGFSGIFIDTLDNAAELERIDSKRYKGMTSAAIELVLTIRRHYPEIVIMLNRAYEVLPAVGGAIDMELGESMYTDYDFNKKNYSKADTKLYQEQRRILTDAVKRNPKLKLFSLDYWDMNDQQGVSEIYKVQKDNGFIPYVSSIELNQIYPQK